MAGRATREFFAVRTVAEALAGFRPARRTGAERVALEDALGRVPRAAVHAANDLPGFARATVDGYAVRAGDTYGASEGLPSYLELAGEVAMGAAPTVAPAVTPGAAVAIPTGALLPAGADAVVMVEHATQGIAGAVEVLRPVAPGEGVVRADEDAAAGTLLVPAGRPLRAADLGMLAAAGVLEVEMHARPRVAILSTGDEVVDPATKRLAPGQVRDATAVALGALVREAGGEPVARGIVPDDPGALEAALRAAIEGVPDVDRHSGGKRQSPPRAGADVVVVSAGSSVGARDGTADAVAALGPPGVWCHGLAVKPGKPTLLADAGGVPIVGLPGNPRSALTVFRLVGTPLVRLVGGCTDPPPAPAVRARLARDVPSAAGRLDVVAVRLRDGVAEPLHGASALLSVLAAADGSVIVPDAATGLAAGTEVEVVLHG